MNYVEYDTSLPVSSDHVNRYFYLLYKLHRQFYSFMGVPELALVLEDWETGPLMVNISLHIYTFFLQGPW